MTVLQEIRRQLASVKFAFPKLAKFVEVVQDLVVYVEDNRDRLDSQCSRLAVLERDKEKRRGLTDQVVATYQARRTDTEQRIEALEDVSNAMNDRLGALETLSGRGLVRIEAHGELERRVTTLEKSGLGAYSSTHGALLIPTCVIEKMEKRIAELEARATPSPRTVNYYRNAHAITAEQACRILSLEKRVDHAMNVNAIIQEDVREIGGRGASLEKAVKELQIDAPGNNTRLREVTAQVKEMNDRIRALQQTQTDDRQRTLVALNKLTVPALWGADYSKGEAGKIVSMSTPHGRDWMWAWQFETPFPLGTRVRYTLWKKNDPTAAVLSWNGTVIPRPEGYPKTGMKKGIDFVYVWKDDGGVRGVYPNNIVKL
jgi:FtsZ-binding cell division protein ZapB